MRVVVQADEGATVGPQGGDHLAALRWGLVVVSCCLLTALVATWPLAANLMRAIPLGNEQGAMVGLFSIWTLWWNADRLAHGFAGYWDAPVFFPNKGVFTYSEPEPLTSLVVAPLWGLNAPPALILNLAFLLILTLNGVFAYRLSRALAATRLGSLLAGILMVALPFVAKVYGVLNLTPLFGLLWTLDGLVRFGKSGSLRHAAWAGLGFVVAYLTCQQYALIFAPFALLAGLVALSEQRFGWRPLLRLTGSGLVAGLLLLPLILPVYSLHQRLGLARQDFVVERLSASLGDFFTRPNTASLPLPTATLEDTGGLFPGLIVLALAVTGGVLGWQGREQRRWIGYLVGSVLLAAVLAMGLKLGGGYSPLGVLRAVVPGFGELRSPFRFAVIMQVMMVVLAALALTHLASRLGRRGPGLILLLTLLGAAENLNVPVPLLGVPLTPATGWSSWILSQPASMVVAHVPFPNGLGIRDYEGEGWRMLAQIDHHQPIVNGYSGYFPPSYTRFQLQMARLFPQRDLLCVLGKDLRVNTLVLDQAWLREHQAAMATFASFLQPAYADQDVQVVRLQIPMGECQLV